MAKGKDKAAERQGSTRLPEHHSLVTTRPLMIARAATAVVACAAAILYLYWLVKASKAFYWTVAAAELSFFVYYWCIKIPFLNIAARQGPRDHDATFIKQRLLEQLLRDDDAMTCMESWFLEARPGEVKTDNLKELFAYAIWYRSLGEMEAEGLMPELDDIMAQLEAKYGRRLPHGYNPNLPFMSHLWEPLRHMYRPLLVYIVMELLTLLCHVALLATGFRLRQIDGITYYTYRVGPQMFVPAISASMKRCCSTLSVPSTTSCNTASVPSTTSCGTVIHSSPSITSCNTASVPSTTSCNTTVIHSSSNKDASSDGSTCPMPIIFLHGVGAGLLPYLALIFRLAALGHPMILPHSKHVSMRLVSWIPTVDDMADATAAMLAAHGYSRASVVAHSYGTMVASRLVMKYPQLVHSMCLTDPVCFAMFMPNLLRNFLYARHSSGCWWQDNLLKFVASELHCSANFSRKFFWSSINLWDEHIPERTLVVLGGKDILSPLEHVDRWLREHTKAQVMYEPSMRHAGMLLSTTWQAAIVTAFAKIMRQPDSAVAAAAAAGVGDAVAPDTATAKQCIWGIAPAAAALPADVASADGVAVVTAVRDAAAAAVAPRPSAQAAKAAPAAASAHVHVCAADKVCLHHACKHPYNRLCSDCRSSIRHSQPLPVSLALLQQQHKHGEQQQQQWQQQQQEEEEEGCAAPATSAGKAVAPFKQQQQLHDGVLEDVTEAAVGSKPAAATVSPTKCAVQVAA